MPRFSFDFKVLTFCLIGLMTTFGNATADDKESGVMTIGSKAPDIDIEHWVSDNDGAFSHTTSLKRDQVYVIEFWATWCGPCISAMPHIADLQKEYGDDIQVISISDEDLETVEKFLERDVRGEEDMTYADLTKTYCLTTDPDESVKKDYFRAAGRTGIPCAFIVGKTGYVEWIGHPMRIDSPLQQVVNDEWDREEYLVAYKKEQEEREAAKKAQAALRKASRKLQGLMRDGDSEAAIEYIDEMLKNDDFAAAKEQLSAMKLQVMVTEDMEGADKELEKYTKANSNNPAALNRLAWAIYEQHSESDGISDTLLKAACDCAKQAAKAEPKNGAVLDTYAHLIYAAHKDIDKAIKVQKQAVEHAGTQIDEIQPFLDELMKAKEEK